MIIGSVRDGLVEAVHPVTVAAVDASGQVLHHSGSDADRSFFARSAIKPLQAMVSIRHGADLGPEQVALASASHMGFPVHVAIVMDMLAEVGLDPGALLCPPDRPASRDADRLWAAAGRVAAEPIFRDCSGKHAAMLRACVASGWSLEYTALDHPLQQAILAFLAESTGRAVEPTGVDGCGIPTLMTDVVGLARAFARVATDPEMQPVRQGFMRYTALTRGGDSGEAVIARWFPGVVKGGAEGCIGVAWPEGGIGFAAKAWTGSDAACRSAIVHLMDRLGVLPTYPSERLDEVRRPVVLGGGRPRGHLELLEA